MQREHRARYHIIIGQISYNINVRISGRVGYQTSLPPSFTTQGIPGVGVWLDWDHDNDPRTSYQPPGHSDDVPVTDMDGRYEFDFSFVSDHPAHHYSSRIRVYVNSTNDAAFDGDAGVGAQFPAYAYIDISNETANITSSIANIAGIDPRHGSALRYLYRARQFSINELGYTPVGGEVVGGGLSKIRYYIRPQSGSFFCSASTEETNCGGQILAVSRIVFGREPGAAIAYHEYGHFIEWDKVRVQVYDDNPGHFFQQESTDNIAWTEGWAEFYNAACHMFWYARETPALPEPEIWTTWGPRAINVVSY